MISSKAKYLFDVEYFKNRDTPEKSYWLGYLFGKAVILKGPYIQGMRLVVKDEDLDHLKKFKKAVGFTGPIRTFVHTGYKKVKRHSITLFSPIWIKNLQALGFFTDRKTNLTYPSLDPFPSDFLRGYLDGSGSYTHSEKHSFSVLSFRGYNTSFLEVISSYISKTLNLGEQPVQSFKNRKQATIYYRGARQALKVAEWLYGGTSKGEPCLHRKRDVMSRVTVNPNWPDNSLHRNYPCKREMEPLEMVELWKTTDLNAEQIGQLANISKRQVREYLAQYIPQEERVKIAGKKKSQSLLRHHREKAS